LLSLHRNDLVVEQTRLLRSSRSLLADERVFVLGLAANSIPVIDHLGGAEHVHVEVGNVFLDPRFYDHEFEVRRLNQADRLDTAGPDDATALVEDLVGPHGYSLQTRGTELGHRRAGSRHGYPGTNRDLAGDVAAGHTCGQCAAEHHVLDVRRLQARSRDSLGQSMSANVTAWVSLK